MYCLDYVLLCCCRWKSSSIAHADVTARVRRIPRILLSRNGDLLDACSRTAGDGGRYYAYSACELLGLLGGREESGIENGGRAAMTPSPLSPAGVLISGPKMRRARVRLPLIHVLLLAGLISSP